MTDFAGLELARPLLRALSEDGYETPTPIQAQAIPALMQDRDLLGVAQTGTGKTAAFALPLLNSFVVHPARAVSRRPQALILAPTRELAGQIHDSLKTYGRYMKIRTGVVFGGAPIRRQIDMLNRGVHILVATPGRLVDLMNQNCVQLDEVDIFVLDEADRMLDMGFAPDLKKIAEPMPTERQTVFFSATMPKTVKTLAHSLLNNPVEVQIAPESTTAEKVEQKVLFVSRDNKRDLLDHLLTNDEMKRVLIFARTKRGADRISRHLRDKDVGADAIHGDKSQSQRQKALTRFKQGKIRALVATDVAARGIDVDGLSHVINYDLPDDAENYVHRIGRTARGGAEGVALSLCDEDQRGLLFDIEKMIRQEVPVIADHPFHEASIAIVSNPAKANRPKRGGGGGGGKRFGGSRSGPPRGGKPHHRGKGGAHRKGASRGKSRMAA